MSEKITILERLEQYTQEAPNEQILFDDTHAKGITYAQLDEMSGRIYAWLQDSGIGREDFVLIDLPRGVLPLIAMIGVWKAGAAWALVEDTYAPERIDYIRRDCGCSVELSSDNWEEVMSFEPLSGHEETDLHDAAYAIYTSGTTGNPKGVLHEYGNLERAILSLQRDGRGMFDGIESAAMLSPLNFVASVIVALVALSVFKVKNYIASYATIKNPMVLAKLFMTKKINATFLTPSYVRMLGGRTTPYLKLLFVGSEPANDLYVKGLDVINVYACSESGYAVTLFTIDRAYDVCPIGKTALQENARVFLLGEDGQEPAPGETGELCFEDPYVRGYINLPEETEKAFVDGIFHSGDLAKQDENGNYVLLGRMGDMIKINGNRIEPAEIEAAVKEALGIDWCAAKGIEKNSRSFLCAYYTADVTFDEDELRETLQKRLPYYMIPSYFIKIDQVPLKANGKLDRGALPEPETTVTRGDYAEPENEVQEKLCNAFAEVLHLDAVGIHDDFYEMGGDSLKSIELLTACDLPGLSTNEIFKGRTPEKIAELYEQVLAENADGTPEERNAEALQEAHPLTVEQRYMLDYQMYTPASTMYNLYSMMKVDKSLISMEEVARIMKEIIAAHPALLTTFFWDDNGYLMQRYTPELLEDIRVEHLSEFEMNFVKDMLVYPFKIIGGKMYRCRVFETEKAGYVFFDVHHSLFDGTSMKVFIGSMRNALTGIPQEPDYYYLMLKNREQAIYTDFYEESRRYFEERYDGIKWSSYPKIDHMSRDNELGELLTGLGIEQDQMKAVEEAYHLTRNEFFITVAALAISVYNNENDIKISWNYNGREDLQQMKTVGLLFRELPVGLRFNNNRTIREVYEDVHEQVRLGIEHSCYPYVDLNSKVAEKEAAYLLYQQDIRDMGGLEAFNIEMVDIRQNQAASQTILDIEILDGEDGLEIFIDFAASWYEEDSMIRFMGMYIGLANILVAETGEREITIGEIRRKLALFMAGELRDRFKEKVKTDAQAFMGRERLLGSVRTRLEDRLKGEESPLEERKLHPEAVMGQLEDHLKDRLKEEGIMLVRDAAVLGAGGIKLAKKKKKPLKQRVIRIRRKR